MARIDHSFEMTQTPADAQAMFVRDIAPEMARDRGFLIARETPGHLLFSDGEAPGRSVWPDLGEGAQKAPADVAADAGAMPDAAPGGAAAVEPVVSGFARAVAESVQDDLPQVFARHVHVDFSGRGDGTQVRIHGHLERDIAHALERLGTPGHWPATAGLPHD